MNKTNSIILKNYINYSEPQSHVPPRLTHVARHISSNQGETVLIPCVAQGHPAPMYRWSRRTSGQTLDISPSDERRHMINGTLILRRVSAQDGGFYVCVAKSEAGEVRSETQLTVKGVEEISILYGTVEVLESAVLSRPNHLTNVTRFITSNPGVALK
ncbi:down syndrome cell adhesion molecule [Trichonephila clavipes]|nr:down syndrome cell adhesion molecule [Trichonephila clavipes]